MNVGSHVLQRVLKLDPPVTRDLVVQRDLRVAMPEASNCWRICGRRVPVASRGRSR